MSSFSSRGVEVWRSSLAEDMGALNGVFLFHVLQSGMVPQLLGFLNELWKSQTYHSAGEVMKSFVEAEEMRFSEWGPVLLQRRSFPDHQHLFAVTMDELQADVRQVELQADLNLTFNRAQYLAWTGGGYQPLLEIRRRQFVRGIGFEVEERGTLRQSILGGDVILSESGAAAFQHYSTGLGLLAGEDQVTGLLDAAFMQFYLSVECLLGVHEKDKADSAGASLFGAGYSPELSEIVKHVYLARHMYFGHGHPKQQKGHQSVEGAFSIAKQILVAKWCARALINLAAGRTLLSRETRLYKGAGGSIEFSGDVTSLKTEFALK